MLLATAIAAADYSASPKAAQLYADLRARYGFSEADIAQVKAALADAQTVPQLIAAERNNKEKTLSWDEYRPLHVNPANVANGLRFMQAQKIWLDKARQQYGVPPEVITALLGVETKFGAFTGKNRVLDALATQGFGHPTRAAFFFDELTQFFVLCRDERLPPSSLLGSYAGAMGDAQFMPSVYRRLAVDFDANGRRDLWSAPDAIGSVANYLVHYDPARSWQSGGALLAAVAEGARPQAQLPRNALRPPQTVGDLANAGVVATVELPAALPAGLIALDRSDGPEYWIALPNFYSVMSYNPRIFYAMSVAELADALQSAETGSSGNQSAPP